MTSAATPRSWEVVPRTPRVSRSSGRLRREPSLRGWTRRAKLRVRSSISGTERASCGPLFYPLRVRPPPFLALLFTSACAHSSPPRVAAAKPAVPVQEVDTGPTSPEVLVPGSNDFDIVNLLADARFAYFGHRGEKGIVKVPLAGGAPITLVPGAETPVTSLAADATYLYFTSGRHVETESLRPSIVPRSTHDAHFEGVVLRVPKDAPNKVVEISSGRFKPEDVAVDGTDVYWIMSKRDATLVRQPLDQIDVPEVVAHGHFSPGSLVVAGGYAYWIDTELGPAVMRVSTRGGEPQKVAQGAPDLPLHPVRLAADDAAVYFSDAGPVEGKGAIVRVSIGAGMRSTLAENLRGPRGLAVRGGTVYWLNKGTSEKNFKDGSLEKSPAAGGPKVTLASDLAAPDRIAVSDSRVVWTEIDGAVKDIGK